MIFLTFVFPAVYAALAQREGKKVTLPTLVTMTGFKPEQIQMAIRNARANDETHARQIVVEKPGREWRFVADTTVGQHLTPEKVAEEIELGAKHIWKLVLKVLMDNPGKVLHKKTIAEAVRVAEPEEYPEFSEQQVSNAMLTMMRNPGVAANIDVLWAGRAWRYNQPATVAAVTAPETKPETKPESKPESKPSVSSSIRNSVLRYFTQKVGETLFVDEIAEDLGFTRKQVQNAMYNLLHDARSTVRHEFDIVTNGSAWRYVPNRPQVTTSSNGQVSHAVAAKVAANTATAYAPTAATTTLPVNAKAVPDIPPVGNVGARLFEEIARLGSDAILVKEAESGAVYRAEPLR